MNAKKSTSSRRSKSRRPLFITVGVIALAVVALFAVYSASNGSNKTNLAGGQYRFAVGDPGPGQPAPPIVLPSTAGGNFDLASLKGKTVLLYFQEGIGCQPCWDQMRDIEARRIEFAAVGIDVFVTITSDSLDWSHVRSPKTGSPDRSSPTRISPCPRPTTPTVTG